MQTILFSNTDYSKGFGGKYGVENDRVDKSAHSWEHQEKLEKHESQKGRWSLQGLEFSLGLRVLG